MEKLHYTYQIKNLINGKTYIGVHTGFPGDNYLGSGVALKRAKDKYGDHNFKLLPLAFFDTRKEAEEEEIWLVDEAWVKSSDNYNIALGGGGGFGSLTAEHKVKGIETRKANGYVAWNKGIKTGLIPKTAFKNGKTETKDEKAYRLQRAWNSRYKNESEENRLKRVKIQGTGVYVDGISYPSIREASRLLNIPYSSLRTKLKRKQI